MKQGIALGSGYITLYCFDRIQLGRTQSIHSTLTPHAHTRVHVRTHAKKRLGGVAFIARETRTRTRACTLKFLEKSQKNVNPNGQRLTGQPYHWTTGSFTSTRSCLIQLFISMAASNHANMCCTLSAMVVCTTIGQLFLCVPLLCTILLTCTLRLCGVVSGSGSLPAAKRKPSPW